LPRLKRTSSDLTRNGPTLDIKIEPILSVQALLRAAGEEIPFANISGMIDTGASGTLIESEVFQSLGIESYDKVRLHTTSTINPLIRGKYRVRVVLSGSIAFDIDAVDRSLTGQNIQCLIERDILEFVTFTYDGPNSRFSINLR